MTTNMPHKNNIWETKKFGDVCGFVRGPFGGSLKKQIFVKHGYAVYEQQHAIYDQFDDVRYFINESKFDEMKRFEINSGDLIMSCSGTMGKVAIVPKGIKKGIINQALLLLKPSKQILNTFIKLWMESEGFQDSLKAYSQGAAIQNVASVKILKAIDVPVPPLPEQQRIVSVLDEAFASIAQAKSNAERNLVNARELFGSYLESLFADSRAGWEEKKLGEVCERITDGTHVTPTYVPEGVPFLSVKNLTKGFIDFSDTRFISPEEHKLLTKRVRPERDDLLYTKVGTTGVAQVVDVDVEFSIFVSIALLKLKHEMIFNKYLEFFLNSPFARKQAQKRTRGMANKNLVITDIKEIEIHFPKSLAEQRAIVGRLEALSAETNRLEEIYQQKVESLEELKRSVLGKAFEGNL